jgi:cell volume regulation protein A
VFLTVMLVELLTIGNESWQHVAASLAQQAILGTIIGIAGGRAVVAALNRLDLAQGLHAPFVMTSALVVYGVAQALDSSGFLAVYLAGLVIGNRPTRAHNTVVVFLDAATWLAQIVMFVLLGLLVWPQRLVGSIGPALAVAATLMLLARPAAVFLCLAPFRFSWREKLFISWVGLRGAVGIFLASIPLLVGLPKAFLYFDVAFVVVLVSLIVQGWTIAWAAHRLHIALPRSDRTPRRVELDLPGQLARELVGYPIGHNSPYLRRRLIPSWAKPTLVVREEQILTPDEAGPVREGDYVYLLAPPERAHVLDRFFVDMPAAPDPHLLGDFFVAGDVTLGAIADVYGIEVPPDDAAMPLASYFAARFARVKQGDTLPFGPVALVAHTVADGKVTRVGLRLVEPDAHVRAAESFPARVRAVVQRALAAFGLRA